MRYIDPKAIRTGVLAFVIFCLPCQVFALTCVPRSEMIERAEVLFAATPGRITLEPAGVSPPEVAIHRFGEIPKAVLEDLEEGETFEMTQCSPGCRTWSGTIQDLPAQVTDPWYEIEVSVSRVWKGSAGATEIIYSTAPLELGIEHVFAVRERRAGAFEFGGPCYHNSVFPVDHADVYDSLGEVLYGIDHNAG